MTGKETCMEWARILRAVIDGKLSCGEALVRIPTVEEGETVPKAFWTAQERLAFEIEFGIPEDADFRAMFTSQLLKLVERLERHALTKP